jgi:hypothetical protein
LSISFEDGERLRAAGFLEWEIEKIAEGTLPDGSPQPPINLNSPVWQRVTESRRNWVDDKIARGWSEADINTNIMDYYVRSPKRTPFDFVKAEYKPVKKRDFWLEIRLRNQRKVKASLKGYFG